MLWHVFATSEGQAWPVLVATYRCSSAQRACTVAAREATLLGRDDLIGIDLYAISAETSHEDMAMGERQAFIDAEDAIVQALSERD